MNRLLPRLLILVLLVYLWPATLHAEPDQNPAIPAYIEKNKHKHDIILQTSKRKKNIKVYFIYNQLTTYNTTKIKAYTDFLLEASKRLQHTEAELIICFSMTPEDIDFFNKNNEHGTLERQIKQCGVKGIFINTNEETASESFLELLENDDRYSTSDIFAVDASGTTLATFDYTRGSIVMTDAKTHKARVLRSTPRNIGQWQGEAMLASYKTLIHTVIRQEEAQKRERKEQEAQEEMEAEREKQAAREQKRKKSLPKWKRVPTSN